MTAEPRAPVEELIERSRARIADLEEQGRAHIASWKESYGHFDGISMECCACDDIYGEAWLLRELTDALAAASTWAQPSPSPSKDEK